MHLLVGVILTLLVQNDAAQVLTDIGEQDKDFKDDLNGFASEPHHCNLTKEETNHENIQRWYDRAPENSKVCSDSIGDLFYCKDQRVCEKDHGLAVFTITYKRKCVKCIGNMKGWALYLFLATFPITVFFLIVFGCGIKATSAPMNCLVCFIQIALYNVSLNLDYYKQNISHTCDPKFYKRMMKEAGFILDVVSIWNLDFFRYGNSIPNFCISEHLKTTHILAMEYIVAIYPLVCIATLYVCIELHDKDFKPLVLLWKPFKKCLSRSFLKNYNPKMSIIEVFATFLLLAYSKLLFTSFNLLAFTTVYTKQGNTSEYIASQMMLNDISVRYLSKEHLPFFILAIVILFIFNILPLLFLLLYPTRLFQKALGCCTRIRWHPLHAFADAFQGCYKNGTNGTSDCRYFAGLYLLIRAIFRISGLVVFTDSTTFSACFILLFHTFSMLFGVARPYRNEFYNTLDIVFLFLAPLPQLWFGVYKNMLGSITQAAVVIYFLIYYFIIATYKILSVCSPRLLEHCKRCYQEKRCIRYELCPRRNHGIEDESVNIDDDDLLDRLENRQNYQPLLMTTSDEQDDHHEESQIAIDSCSNYGTIN